MMAVSKKMLDQEPSEIELLLPFLHKGFQLSLIKTEFCFLFCNMHLQKALNNTVVFGGLFIDLQQQAKAVYRMDHRNERGNVFYFVALKMADEMPLNVPGQFGLFLHQFLHIVFTKDALTGIIKLPDV